jgi:hypothetical protein
VVAIERSLIAAGTGCRDGWTGPAQRGGETREASGERGEHVKCREHGGYIVSIGLLFFL